MRKTAAVILQEDVHPYSLVFHDLFSFPHFLHHFLLYSGSQICFTLAHLCFCQLQFVILWIKNVDNVAALITVSLGNFSILQMSPDEAACHVEGLSLTNKYKRR